MSEQETGPAPELDAEREIDLGAILRRIAHRWWLPVAGLIIGGALGFLLSSGGGGWFEAKSLVYLGQTYGPGGGQLHTLETYPGIISQIVESEPVLAKAAAASDLSPDALEGYVTSRAVNASGRAAGNLAPLIEVTVLNRDQLKAESAAASVASSVLAQLSTYVEHKITLLKGQVAENDKAIAAATRQLEAALAARKQALANKQLSLSDRLLVQANANATLQFYEARLTNRRADRNTALQLLDLATEVERGRVVAPTPALQTPVKSRRHPAVIGALIGLLIGTFAAYLVEPLQRLRKGRAQAA